MPSPRTCPHRIRPSDPYLRWMVAQDAPQEVAADGDHVAWRHEVPWSSRGWITARGDDPTRVAGLVERLHAVAGSAGYTVPQTAGAAAQDRLGGLEPRDWCWWVRQASPESAPGVIPVANDDERILPLLAHSSSAYILPGDERVVRWSGVVEEGELVSVAGATRERSGAWHLVSVCTHPRHRGRGLAALVCRALIDEAHAAGAPAVVLEMYSDNEAGRGTYRGLGFTEEARFRSCVLDAGITVPA